MALRISDYICMFSAPLDNGCKVIGECDPTSLISEIRAKCNSALVLKAVEYAIDKHDGVNRKGSKLRGFDIPFIVHPLKVGLTLIDFGLPDNVVAAGILHDTVEDTDATYEDLEKHFGAQIANYVRRASEHDKSDTWENRKQQTIDEVSTAPLAVLFIELADKLDNMQSIYDDLQIMGDKTWSLFKRGRDSQEWYYKSLLQAFANRATLENRHRLTLLTQEYSLAVLDVFGL